MFQMYILKHSSIRHVPTKKTHPGLNRQRTCLPIIVTHKLVHHTQYGPYQSSHAVAARQYNYCTVQRPSLIVIVYFSNKDLWNECLSFTSLKNICISYEHLPPLCWYFLSGQQIPLKSVVKYLRIFIKWGDHVKYLVFKASHSLRHTLFS